jgi:ribosomal RNA-processing protein 9
MPDPFFTSSKSRKRKRSATSKDAGPQRNSTKFSRTKPPLNGKSKTASKANGVSERKRSRKADEELDSDHTNEEDGGGVEDMELRASTDDGGVSGEEDIDETPAEKRLRLAKLYLESVKEGLGE